MNIQNIQMNQEQLFAAEVRSGSTKRKISAESSNSLPENTAPQPQVKTVSDSTSTIDVYCPPLFPLGHTQGIYEIGSQKKSDNVSSDAGAARKVSGDEDKTAIKEDTERQKNVRVKDGKIGGNEPASIGTSAGSLLSLKV